MRRYIFPLAIVLCTICTSFAFAQGFAIHVDSTIDRKNSPTYADFQIPGQFSPDEAKAFAAAQIVLMPGDLPAQAEVAQDEKGGKVLRLYWVEADIKAGKTKVYKVEEREVLRSRLPLKFKDEDSHRDLYLGDKPVWRHDQLAYDKEEHFQTYKHFHQVYDFHGNGFITQGNDGKQYPHHRGLYMGWSKTGAEGKSYDTWHCSKDVSVRHKSFVRERQMTGPVLARSTSVAEWVGGDGKVLVTEQREVTTWNLGPGALAMDFDFTLSTTIEEVQLNGDPQHAGFQFRAHGTVGQTKAKYIYPATAKGKGGDVWENCAWVTNTFKIGDHNYAVAYLDHPHNPGTKQGQTVFSTRNYGRFGAFAQHKLSKHAPLNFRYRILILDADKQSDLSVKRFDADHAAFLKAVSASIGPG